MIFVIRGLGCAGDERKSSNRIFFLLPIHGLSPLGAMMITILWDVLVSSFTKSFPLCEFMQVCACVGELPGTSIMVII